VCRALPDEDVVPVRIEDACHPFASPCASVLDGFHACRAERLELGIDVVLIELQRYRPGGFTSLVLAK
jgi:hypothetical protein